MTLKHRLRQWLGIIEIQKDQATLHHTLKDIRWLQGENSKNMITILSGIGRIVSKIDAQYARSEFDPVRIAESKKLEEEIIKRLQGEATARAPYND